MLFKLGLEGCEVFQQVEQRKTGEICQAAGKDYGMEIEHLRSIQSGKKMTLSSGL